MDEDIQQVVERELRLLQAEVRRDARQVLTLLHPEFTEYGSSGRVWDRTSITDATTGTLEDIPAMDMTAHRLGPDAALVTYRTGARDRHALRSSTWVRHEGTWLLLFHQGTPAADH